MFKLSATKVDLSLDPKTLETLTSGSQNIYYVQFAFDDSWDGLTKTAVFYAKSNSWRGKRVSILLDENGQCIIPPDVLTSHGCNLYVGVLGTLDTDLVDTVMPTVMVNLGQILEGSANGELYVPTPNIYSQILNVANNALEVAQSVREDADAGEFAGPGVPPGGTTGQVPVKKSDADYDVEWGYVEGGGGSGSPGGYYIPSVSQADDSTMTVSFAASQTGMGAVQEQIITLPAGPMGPAGPAGKDGKDGSQGTPGKDGSPGTNGADGQDGITPHIGDNGNWWVGETDTGKPSRGAAGSPGKDGSPGADGADGKDGAQGPQGPTGPAGADGKDGADGQDGDPGVYYGSGDPPASAMVQVDPEGDDFLMPLAEEWTFELENGETVTKRVLLDA